MSSHPQTNVLRLMARIGRKPTGRARATRCDATDCVLLVLGYHEIGDDGRHRISPVCKAALRRAEALAAEAPPRAVIFTGWSSSGGPAEADQMAQEWKGPRDIALFREPHAVHTAQNAVRSLALLQRIEGASELVVVCSIRHFPRVRFLFDRLYRRHGYATHYRYVVRP